ncbi:hypothetical protein [Nocardia sp. NPDC052566]|uniref:hypothetical protein n=1 Tax=Nocardia sp. NPDC052566 TaxID=3364330 RepID=UPI0037C7FB32
MKARERERIVGGAVRDYIGAWQAIMRVEAQRDKDVAALHQQIEDVRSAAAEEIDGYQRSQAGAAAAMHAQGRNVDEIAELLEATPRDVRQLLAKTRGSDTAEQATRPNESAAQRAVSLARHEAVETSLRAVSLSRSEPNNPG